MPHLCVVICRNYACPRTNVNSSYYFHFLGRHFHFPRVESLKLRLEQYIRFVGDLDSGHRIVYVVDYPKNISSTQIWNHIKRHHFIHRTSTFRFDICAFVVGVSPSTLIKINPNSHFCTLSAPPTWQHILFAAIARTKTARTMQKQSN